MMRTITEALCAVAPECDPERLDPDRPLREQLDLDSVDLLHFIMEVEDHLGVSLLDHAFDELATLNGFLRSISGQPIKT
ncbi:acyl carrier protein [Telmatospirillum sp. J64-1]|uniref:acyl carrier protein n=1 Tax=Telmatospirillum sp. J64-1 TaxID=2502183 RepID=UPI00115CB670|nr:acyl carrier protein [Telmatospirillum sp. J64-1]